MATRHEAEEQELRTRTSPCQVILVRANCVNALSKAKVFVKRRNSLRVFALSRRAGSQERCKPIQSSERKCATDGGDVPHRATPKREQKGRSLRTSRMSPYPPPAGSPTSQFEAAQAWRPSLAGRRGKAIMLALPTGQAPSALFRQGHPSRPPRGELRRRQGSWHS